MASTADTTVEAPKWVLTSDRFEEHGGVFTCPKCSQVKPLTTDHWFRFKAIPGALNVGGCKSDWRANRAKAGERTIKPRGRKGPKVVWVAGGERGDIPYVAPKPKAEPKVRKPRAKKVAPPVKLSGYVMQGYVPAAMVDAPKPRRSRKGA